MKEKTISSPKNVALFLRYILSVGFSAPMAKKKKEKKAKRREPKNKIWMLGLTERRILSVTGKNTLYSVLFVHRY